MKLSLAREMRLNYYGEDKAISIDENGYIKLNDLAAFFPKKDIKEWRKNKSTEELISVVDNILNRGNSPLLKTSIISKRGKYYSGTYAHELVAMDFAAWLSVEFKLKVYQAYLRGTQTKKDWNFKRELACYNFKMMQEAVKNAHEEPKHYHYSNEALLLNEIVFGKREANVRDNATEEQLDIIAHLETQNAAFINIDLSYEDRKKHLAKIYADIMASKNKLLI